MKMNCYLLGTAVLVLSGGWCRGGDLAEQRLQLGELPAMRRVLESPEANMVLRRTAFRNILKTPEAETAAVQALSDRDVEIRKAAVYYLRSRQNRTAEAALIRAGEDKSPEVRLLAVLALSGKSSPESRNFLKTVAARESDPQIRKAALNTSPLLSGNRRLLRDDPFWDYEIVKVGAFTLPETFLKFQADPIADGQSKGYQEAGFNDSGWKIIRFGDWRQQGYPEYRGTAWYRVQFAMPEKMEHNAVELVLPEAAGNVWIWLNGVFAGESENTENTRALRFDVTAEINWNARNELAVRVAGNGQVRGLLKPLVIEVLK